MNTAVYAYKQAVADFAEGTVTQGDVDAAKSAAQTVGNEYAQLTRQIRNENTPVELGDDALFSNPTLQNEQRRGQIGMALLGLNEGQI
jgi:hypothetical protein